MYLGKGDQLKQAYPDIFSLASLGDSTSYIIEAVGTGIHIVPLGLLISHSDYLGIIRPRLSQEKISRSLKKAISCVGREYDFSFNFYSDTSYVCSALVMKSYLRESADDE